MSFCTNTYRIWFSAITEIATYPCHTRHNVDRDSSVRIATRYKFDDQGIESQWGRNFRHSSRPALVFIPSPVHWVPTRSFKGLRQPKGGGDHPPHLSPRLEKELSYICTHTLGHRACYTVNFTLTLIILQFYRILRM